MGHPLRAGRWSIEQWAPWTALTIVWLQPLLIGIGLALDARRRGRGDALGDDLVVHSVIAVGATGPALLDRLVILADRPWGPYTCSCPTKDLRSFAAS